MGMTLAFLLAAAAPPALSCQQPDEAEAGEPLVLECTISPADAAVAVVLFRRQGGVEAYRPEPALRLRKGAFRVWLCGSTVTPGPLHFYFEARDRDDQVVARSGRFE